MKNDRRLRQAAMLLLGITFLIYGPVVAAAEGGPRILGTVVASGNASMKAALDRWVPVDEKTHLLVDGTALKTEEGTMSVTMKDGASMEVGKRTDLVVNGAPGNYLMRLKMGTVVFKIYEGTGLFVTTPSTSVVVQRVSGAVENIHRTFKDEISGIITHDGRDTQVYCLRGKFNVMHAAAETLTLTEGNRVAVEDPLATAQTAAAQAAAPAGSGTAGTSPAVVKAYENPAKVPEVLEEVNTGGLEVVSGHTP